MCISADKLIAKCILKHSLFPIMNIIHLVHKNYENRVLWKGMIHLLKSCHILSLQKQADQSFSKPFFELILFKIANLDEFQFRNLLSDFRTSLKKKCVSVVLGYVYGLLKYPHFHSTHIIGALWPVLWNSVPKLGHDFLLLWLHFHSFSKNSCF